MEAVIADALKAFWENVLNHPADEAENGKGEVFDLAGFMVAVPITNNVSVILFNSAH